MRDHVLKMYESTLAAAEALVADVPCERFCEAPFDQAKHPAWVLGHLCLGSGMVLGYMRGEPEKLGGVPMAWAEACMGGPITTDRGSYPKKEELLSTLKQVHTELAAAYAKIDDATLALDFPDESYRSYFPTNGDAAFYIMAYHEGYHLGQLSQWKRAAGFDSSAVDG